MSLKSLVYTAGICGTQGGNAQETCGQTALNCSKVCPRDIDVCLDPTRDQPNQFLEMGPYGYH